MARFLRTCIGLTIALTLVGCGGKSAPVSGTVTLNGKAVPGATVVFVQEGGGSIASGLSDDQGKYTLSGPNGTKIPFGNYKIVVVKTKAIQNLPDVKDGASQKDINELIRKQLAKDGAGASLLPALYATAAKTPLKAQVPAPENTVNIELKTKS